MCRRGLAHQLCNADDPFKQAQITEVLFRLTKEHRKQNGKGVTGIFENPRTAGYFSLITTKNWKEVGL